jgi:hypothetical protein
MRTNSDNIRSTAVATKPDPPIGSEELILGVDGCGWCRVRGRDRPVPLASTVARRPETMEF